MGDTLATLIEEVQYELGQAASPAVGQNFREHIKNRIKREYRRLYHDFDWPHLREVVAMTTSAGQRYYDYPTGVHVEQVIDVWRRWGSRWGPIERGISLWDYNVFDSDNGGRADPVLKWQPHGAAQLEIWPVPVTGGVGALKFTVKRAFTPLVDESDICDLDTDLVVLHAAGELARRFDNDDAAILVGRATQHYQTLRSRSQKGGIRANFSKGPREIDNSPMSYAIVGAGSDPAAPNENTITLSVFVAGKPDPSELVLRTDIAVAFAANIAISSATAGVAFTASKVWTLTLNDVAWATITFAAGSTVGVFAFLSTAVAAGTIFKVIAPAVQDATGADISITVAGAAT